MIDNEYWLKPYNDELEKYIAPMKISESKYLKYLQQLCQDNPRIKNLLLSADGEHVKANQKETQDFYTIS